MTTIDPQYIRNFAIIAHIDHGKSTMADRLIERCGALSQREMKEQVLDSMDIERERGITIKAQTVRLQYKAKDGHTYYLNLMDTPGHVDFAYEVSRCLAACEGSLLMVDASQGVEAQTLANVYHALDHNLEIIPVLNKIDLPAADPDRVKNQIEEIIGLDTSNAIHASGKTGLGVDDILEAIITRIPPPKPAVEESLCALLVDSWYDAYLGVMMMVRVYSGSVKPGMRIRLLSNGAAFDVSEVGIFSPKREKLTELGMGQVGYVVAGIKSVADCKVGDTVTNDKSPIAQALPGFKKATPVVFCGLFPIDSADYEKLRECLGKLALNDASFSFEPENSPALGFGYRCGFLGLLHMEIIQERLEREFDLDLITTAPSVVYRVHKTNGELVELHNPSDMPDPTHIESMEEPWIKATIFVPDEYLGSIITLCTEKRGKQKDLTYIGSRAMMVYELPLNEVVFDFYDRLKSISRGYASFDYELMDYRESELVKLGILVNHEPVDALSMVIHINAAEKRGRAMCEKLKDLIPRQMFAIPIQAAIGAKVIARETISAFRKDVTAKCYGGDISRKRKLLEKQKAGKKRMRMVGSVEIPQAAFLAAFKLGED